MEWKHPWFEPTMLVGAKAGGYTLESVLGSGGFGTVYLTRSPAGNPLAIKVLYPPRSRETADLENWNNRASHFQREIQFAARFNHPNIMKIHYSGSLFWHYDDPSAGSRGPYRTGDYTLPYYVTDYLPDGVDQRLSNGLFTSEEAVKIGKQVCDALETLHSGDPRILHLDLNPSNIRLAKDGRAVITDFGLVQVEGLPQGYATREVSFIPPYVSAPEQRAGEELDVRTDVYQVGALLFYMLTGKSRREAAVLTLLDQPHVPRSLASVIEHCTRHDKEMRFQDISTLNAALLAAKASRFEKFFQMPAHRIVDFLSQVDKKVGDYVLPVWRKPALWALATLLVVGGYVLNGTLTKPVEITMANSSAKREWIEQAEEKFNRISKKERDFQLHDMPFFGRPVNVANLCEEIQPGRCDDYRSGSMVRDILARKITPTVASPAEQSWIRDLKENYKGSRPIISGEVVDVARTPFVIAMWRSRAQAMGCWPSPSPDCTWRRLRALAANPDGWAILGHPEWGKLKFGYGFPGKSNSGTFTQVFNCMGGLQKTTPLMLGDVRFDNGCGQALADFHKAVIIIREKSEEVLAEMWQRGPDFLDASSTNEQEVIRLNREHGSILLEPIVAVYPQDGIVMNTHPFVILNGAPWVTPEEAKAAKIFLEFLLSSEQQSLLPNYGLRPASPTAPLAPPIDSTYGANPSAKSC